MLASAYFEDLTVGDVCSSHARVVTRTDMDVLPITFGALHPLFYSDSYSRNVMGRKRSQASSLVPLCLAVGLLCQAGIFREATRLTEWRNLEFLHDPFLGEGDIVHVTSKIRAKEQIDEFSGKVVVNVTLLQQDDAVVLAGEASAVVLRKGGQ